MCVYVCIYKAHEFVTSYVIYVFRYILYMCVYVYRYMCVYVCIYKVHELVTSPNQLCSELLLRQSRCHLTFSNCLPFSSVRYKKKKHFTWSYKILITTSTLTR